jgi:hypothetical protein
MAVGNYGCQAFVPGFLDAARYDAEAVRVETIVGAKGMDPLEVAELACAVEALIDVHVLREAMVANPGVVKSGDNRCEIFFGCVIRYDKFPIVVVLRENALYGSRKPL